MQYFKVREVLANDSGNTDEHIVGRDENAPFESWTEHESSEADELLSAEESKILGHWYYDGERDEFIFDRTAASFLGVKDHHDAQSPHVVTRILNSLMPPAFTST